jgi:hypothetical protein
MPCYDILAIKFRCLHENVRFVPMDLSHSRSFAGRSAAENIQKTLIAQFDVRQKSTFMGYSRMFLNERLEFQFQQDP